MLELNTKHNKEVRDLYDSYQDEQEKRLLLLKNREEAIQGTNNLTEIQLENVSSYHSSVINDFSSALLQLI